MQTGMKLTPTPFETLTPETHGFECRIESFETQMPIDVTMIESEAGTVGCEMSYRDDSRSVSPRALPKAASGTVYNWHGSPTLSDTPTGQPAPVIVASQQIAVSAPKMSVRTSMFGPTASFSDLPISA